MAGRGKWLSNEEIIDMMNRSGALSVVDSSDSEDVDDVQPQIESDCINNIEIDELYDSDVDEEYVPLMESASSDEFDGDDAPPRKKKRKIYTSTPIKSRAPASTSAAAPASTSAAAPASTSAAAPASTSAAAPASTSAAAPASTSAAAPASTSAAAPASTSADAPASTSSAASASGGRRGKRRQVADAPPVVDFNKTTISSRNFRWSCQPCCPANMSTPRSASISFGSVACKSHLGLPYLAATSSMRFLSRRQVQEIVAWTNKRIELVAARMASQGATYSATEPNEILALLGVLIVAGQQRDNHLSLVEMWSTMSGCPMYRAAMSKGRFEFLISCLRFDNPETRDERKRQDKFAPVRKVWDEFIENCGRLYVPHENLTVDEQLLGFRGKCPFRMYIPNKPAKYGIKLVIICDSETKYLLGAIPYLGKQGTRPRDGVNLGHYFTKELTRPYHGTNRNVTTDNWFTSVPLVADLLNNCGMTLVGTVRANKAEIPHEMKAKETRQHGSSAFLFTKEMTLVSYMAHTSRTKKKIVLLLSSQHTQPTIASSGKPEIIEFYNATKGGVDTFDQMCATSSCSRKTRRWSLCLWYGILNTACINAFIISCENRARTGISIPKRRSFMMNMGRTLITPWAQSCLASPVLSRQLHTLITTVCGLPSLGHAAGSPGTSFADSRSPLVRCSDCPSRSDRKTNHHCTKCAKPKCPRHLYPSCGDCV
ncbi:hypothetical protein Pcinc_001779 [Petrolisthes cinctipes]|uniref:PiggyBac transposable element-derived protein domain-containing protein n=2 Tax=Petrolisthes cinctipes TaxID=88211 RepID=A0AAE1L5S6_PETCI|nr:hypothetical protein Pcinc_001779 [Petrolisthes cinctipes]